MLDTKSKIIEAAVELFSRYGYSSTTTRAIAQLAGVNESTFFRIYKSKSLILSDILYVMTPGPDDVDTAELTGGLDLEKDMQIFLFNNAFLHIKHMPVFRLAMHVDEIYNQQRFSKIKGMVKQFGDYLQDLYNQGMVEKIDFFALSEFVNSLVLLRATEFMIGESYGIPPEQSAQNFAKQYAPLFVKLLRPES